MKKAESYDEIAGLVSKQFRRGVMTNNFITEDGYRQGIKAGSLYYHEWGGGLAVLLERDGFFRMYYHIVGAGIPFYPADTVVTEIPNKPGRDDEAAVFWISCGFLKKLERVRLCRLFSEVKQGEDPFEIRLAEDKDIGAVAALLCSCFDKYTGCIPREDELSPGSVYCAFGADGSLSGVLHFSQKGKVSEIRHLAVREGQRGRGVASALLNHYLDGVNKSLVWTAADNTAALGLYKKHGYEPDGWNSKVLIYNP